MRNGISARGVSWRVNPTEFPVRASAPLPPMADDVRVPAPPSPPFLSLNALSRGPRLPPSHPLRPPTPPRLSLSTPPPALLHPPLVPSSPPSSSNPLPPASRIDPLPPGAPCTSGAECPLARELLRRQSEGASQLESICRLSACARKIAGSAPRQAHGACASEPEPQS